MNDGFVVGKFVIDYNTVSNSVYNVNWGVRNYLVNFAIIQPHQYFQFQLEFEMNCVRNNQNLFENYFDQINEYNHPVVDGDLPFTLINFCFFLIFKSLTHRKNVERVVTKILV